MMEKIGRFGLVPVLAGAPMKAGFREGLMPGSSLANLSLGFSWRIVERGRDKPVYGESRPSRRFGLSLSAQDKGGTREAIETHHPVILGSDTTP
jgi:hypothetical protein